MGNLFTRIRSRFLKIQSETETRDSYKVGSLDNQGVLDGNDIDERTIGGDRAVELVVE